MTKSFLGAVAPLAAVLLATTACAPSSTPSAQAPASSTSRAATSAPSESGSTSPAPSDGTSPATSDGSSPADNSGTADLGDPVATKTLTRNGDQVTLRVYQPQRTDQLVTLSVDLTFDKRRDESAVPDSGLLANDGALSQAKRIPNGFGLVDTAGQKMYLPATTGEDQDFAVCSPSFPTEAKAGDRFSFSCVFAGVPQSLVTVTVRSDTFGSFPNVGIK